MIADRRIDGQAGRGRRGSACASVSITPHSGAAESGLPRPRNDSAGRLDDRGGQGQRRLDEHRRQRVRQDVRDGDLPRCARRARSPRARSRCSPGRSSSRAAAGRRSAPRSMPTAIITVIRLGPRIAAMLTASSRLGIASSMSTTRMSTLSSRRPHLPPRPNAAPARPPISAADGEAEERRDHADQQRLPGTDDHPAELVAALVVVARASARRDGPGMMPAPLRPRRSRMPIGSVGLVRHEERPDERDQHEEQQDDRADDARPGCGAAAEAPRATGCRPARRRARGQLGRAGRACDPSCVPSRVIAPSPSGR